MLKKKCAHTLVELLMSLAIFTVIIGSLFAVVISQNNFLAQATADMDVGMRARKVMDNMIKELRRSKLELVEIYDTPLSIGGAVDYSDGISVVFSVPVDFDDDGDMFDEWGRIEWGNEQGLDGSIEYYWDINNATVVRALWDPASKLLNEIVIADHITEFKINAFSYWAGALVPATENAGDAFAPEVVTITVTAEKDTVGGRVLATPITYTLNNSVTWRN